jgi:quinol monooxygenase YgiN
MNKYGFYGKFKTQIGKRDELLDILLQASKLVSTAKGCHQYLVSKDLKNENLVYVTEIWNSKEDHDNSLKVEGCKELISRAIPLMDGQPEIAEFEIVGGKDK